MISLRVINGDDFIRNLWDVHVKVKAEGYTQVCIYMTALANNGPYELSYLLFTCDSSLYPWAFLDQTTWFIKTMQSPLPPSK